MTIIGKLLVPGTLTILALMSGCEGLWKPYIGTINLLGECASKVCATGVASGTCAYHQITASERWQPCEGASCMAAEITKVQSFMCDQAMQPIAPVIGQSDIGVRTGTSLTNEPLECRPIDKDLVVFQSGTLEVDWTKTPCIWRAESDPSTKNLLRVNLIAPETPATYSLTITQSSASGATIGTMSGIESGRWYYADPKAASVATMDVRFFDSSMKVNFRHFTLTGGVPSDPVCSGSQQGMNNGTCLF